LFSNFTIGQFQVASSTWTMSTVQWHLKGFRKMVSKSQGSMYIESHNEPFFSALSSLFELEESSFKHFALAGINKSIITMLSREQKAAVAAAICSDARSVIKPPNNGPITIPTP